MRFGIRARSDGFIGVLLGIGAPSGLLVMRALLHRASLPETIGFELSNDPALYLYVTAGSVLVIGAFGALLGRHEDQILRITWVDALTGLWNRRLFDRRLAEEVARSARHGTPMTLLILDLDHFKLVNDNFGHQNGDRVLKTISTLVHDGFRSTDVVCRYGGEEIAIIAPNTALEDAERLAERTRERIAETVIPLNGQPNHITISIGLAEAVPGIGDTELTGRADAALYEAKRLGRNKTCTSNGSALVPATER